MITESQFLKATVKDISQVYKGKRNHCRCGCAGEYTPTSFMINPQGNVNDNLITKRLRRMQRAVQLREVEVEYGETYVDVKIGDNQSMTFYFDDVMVR